MNNYFQPIIITHSNSSEVLSSPLIFTLTLTLLTLLPLYLLLSQSLTLFPFLSAVSPFLLDASPFLSLCCLCLCCLSLFLSLLSVSLNIFCLSICLHISLISLVCLSSARLFMSVLPWMTKLNSNLDHLTKNTHTHKRFSIRRNSLSWRSISSHLRISLT